LSIVSGHVPEKTTSFCFPEKVFFFRFRVIVRITVEVRVRVEVWVRVCGNTFKYFSVKRTFRQVYWILSQYTNKPP